MTRSLLCTVLLLGSAAAARAGELDRESASPLKPAKAALTPATAAAATELDGESPTPAHRWRGYYGGWGYRGGYGGWGYRGGYGGWGYGPRYGYGYGSYYRGFSPWYG